MIEKKKKSHKTPTLCSLEQVVTQTGTKKHANSWKPHTVFKHTSISKLFPYGISYPFQKYPESFFWLPGSFNFPSTH